MKTENKLILSPQRTLLLKGFGRWRSSPRTLIQIPDTWTIQRCGHESTTPSDVSMCGFALWKRSYSRHCIARDWDLCQSSRVFSCKQRRLNVTLIALHALRTFFLTYFLICEERKSVYSTTDGEDWLFNLVQCCESEQVTWIKFIMLYVILYHMTWQIK